MEIIINFCVGVLGVIAHSCFKFMSLKSKADAGNVTFSFRVYVNQDLWSIIGSLCAVGIWVFAYDEFSTNSKWLVSHKVTSYAAVGFCGSYLIQYFASRADKKITSIINSKTNIFDQTEKPTTDINTKLLP